MDAKALEVMANALPAAYVVGGPILEAIARSQEAIAKAEAASDDEVALEARKQKIVMDLQAHAARVAQELAIAERMASADVVEIEEYYEGTGKGAAGLQVEGSAVLAGLSGEGRRVTKRVIKLSGLVVVPVAVSAAEVRPE